MFRRLLPLLLVSVTVMLDIICFGPPDILRMCCNLLGGCVLLLAYPLDHEEPALSNWFSALFVPLFLLLFVAVRAGGMPEECLLALSSLAFCAYLHFCNSMKYKDVRNLFRPDSAICKAEEDARSSYACAYLALTVLVSLAIMLEGGLPVRIPVLLLSLALYACLHYRAYSGRALFLPRKKENKIREIIRAGSRAISLPDVQDGLLNTIFERVQKHMETRKPFLKEAYSLDDLSRDICVNKTYISRAVNAMSGKNFRQYINYQRVMYSIEEMKKNPDLKVIELAFMSGFHSVVTYNLCFRMFLDATPSDYLYRFRLARKRQSLPGRGSGDGQR